MDRDRQPAQACEELSGRFSILACARELARAVAVRRRAQSSAAGAPGIAATVSAGQVAVSFFGAKPKLSPTFRK